MPAKKAPAPPPPAQRVPPPGSTAAPREARPARDRVLAAVGYVGPLVFVPLLVPHKRRFLSYHTRHALYFFVLFLSLSILTIGLLWLFWPDGPALRINAVFQFLAVVFVLELILYGLTMIALIVAAALGRMPMLPVLGELAGER